MKDDRLYVIHIGECLACIAHYVAGGRETFLHSTLIQDAVLRYLQTIGQSVGHLSETLREAHPEIDWRSIIGLRDVQITEYRSKNLRAFFKEIPAADITERKIDLTRFAYYTD